MKRRALATILPLAILFSFVLPQTACTPEQLAFVKAGGRTIERLIDSGINLVPAFVANGDIDPADSGAVLGILGDAKKAIHEFNVGAAGFTSFSATSKQDLARLFKAVSTALAQLNAEGVTKIKDPTLRGRVQIGLTAINLAASEIEASLSDSAQASDLKRSLDKITAAASDIEDAFNAAVTRGD